MTLQVTGNNVEAGEAFTAYVVDRLSSHVAKYTDQELSGHIRLGKERGQFRTECSVRLGSGLRLEASGAGGDAYASADAAVEHLETRLRRHRRRLKNHHATTSAPVSGGMVPEYTVEAGESEADLTGEDGGHPVVIAEIERNISVLAVSDAVMRLDLAEKPFLVFRNAAHGGLNLVYRRADGHIGWIDLTRQDEAGTNGKTYEGV